MLYDYRQLQQLLKVARELGFIGKEIKLNSKKEILTTTWNALTSDQQRDVLNTCYTNQSDPGTDEEQPKKEKKQQRNEGVYTYAELVKLALHFHNNNYYTTTRDELKYYLRLARAFNYETCALNKKKEDMWQSWKKVVHQVQQQQKKEQERQQEQERAEQEYQEWARNYREAKEREQQYKKEQEKQYHATRRSIYINGYDIFSVPQPRNRDRFNSEWLNLCFNVLGRDTATIRNNYRTIARQWHPDLNGDKEVIQIINVMKETIEAYAMV